MGALRTIRSYPESNQAIVALPRNSYFFVTGIFPDSAKESDFVTVVSTGEGNSRMVTAYTDLVMLVVGLHESGNGCKHVLFARMDEHNDKQLGSLGGNSIPEEDLKKIVPILFDKAFTRYQVFGKDGIARALVYKHEVGIPNFNGNSLWILTKEEYKNLKNPPPPAAAKPTEVKKDLVNDAIAKKALQDEATAKKKIALAAKKYADAAEKKATSAETKADKATQDAIKARGEANAALKAANDAIIAYEQAAAKTT